MVGATPDAHARLFSGPLSEVSLVPYIVCGKRDGSDQTALMQRLA